MSPEDAAPAPLRVLVVGCGNIASGFDHGRAPGLPPLSHAGAYARHPRFEIAACLEPDAARRQAFAERWGVPLAAAGADELLSTCAPGRFDLISICSPTSHHAEHLALALALRPRAVFCEKPLTPHLALSRTWVERLAEAGIALAVNHSRRWDPDVAALAEELAAGRWGAVRCVSAHYNKGVLNNGAHMMDLLAQWLGPLVPAAVGAPVHDHWADDPSVPALLTAAGGVAVHLAVADARDYAMFEVQIVAERGTVAMEDGGQAWRVREAVASPHFGGYRSLAAGERRSGRYNESMARAVDNLAAALDHGAPLACTGREALAAQALCEALREAAEARGDNRRPS
jgi:predicted dehydrogenase